MHDNMNLGWRGIDERQAFAARPFPKLSTVAPHLFQGAAPTDPVILYKAWKDVLGKYPDYPAQQIGDCVSFGWSHGHDLLQCVELAMESGNASSYRETDTEFTYGESRKVAGILGRQDGSYGSAAAKALTTVGTVSREMLGTDGAYSGQRAKSWGYSGPPAEVEKMAADYKLGGAALVSTWDELVAAITNGYPVPVSSNWGYNTDRDDQGFCAARGTWGHCMMIAGVRFDRPGALICQSWGPDQPQGGLALDQPTFSFWADAANVGKMLAQGDSFAMSKAAQFVKRPLPSSWSYLDMA